MQPKCCGQDMKFIKSVSEEGISILSFECLVCGHKTDVELTQFELRQKMGSLITGK